MPETTIPRLDLRGQHLTLRELKAALPRAEFDVEAALDAVRPIVADVAERGAPALYDAAERFDGTVLERAMEAHRAVLGMRAELDELHARLAGMTQDDPELEPTLERSGELQHHLELHDEHALEPEAPS